MSVQERLDVADIDGGPVGLGAAGGQELREVTHRGDPGLKRGVPARVGAGAASTVTTPEEVIGESSHRAAQRFGHRVDAGLTSGRGATSVAIGRQRQLVRGEKVFQGPRERHVGGDGFQQRLRMRWMIVDQVLAESGEHGACAAGVMAADQAGGEVAEPVGWIGQCMRQIGGTHLDPVR